MSTIALRLAIAAAIAAVTVSIPPAHAQGTEPVKKFSIPAQSLSQALLDFSRQADVVVTAPSDLVQGKTAPAILGDLTPKAAMSKLLEGSGLEASYTPSGGITIAQPAAPAETRPTESRAAPTGALAPTTRTLPTSEPARTEVSVLEEVLVTAQKRTENMQDVPSSISVFSNERLQQLHATTITDYAAYIPGLIVTSGGGPGQTTITLRGIAPVGPGSVVGYYIDDTPLGSSSNYGGGREYGLDLMPYDVERVEVLRGPQGTLYGAGSMGGLLKYVLRDPDLSDFDVQLGVETSSVAEADDLGWGARAAVNAPLVSERLGLWVSYFKQETPGYIDNALTGVEDENDVGQQGGRATLLWQIKENVSLQLGGMWQQIDSDNDATTSLTLTSLNPPRGAPTRGDLTSFHPLPQIFEKDLDYYSATLNWDLGWATFTSATGYSDTQIHNVLDGSFIFGILYPLLTGGVVPAGLAPFRTTLDLEKKTQELRLTSPSGGAFEWMIGAYYTKEDSNQLQEVFALDANRQLIPQFSPLFVFAEFPADYEEIAGFGSMTFKLTERFDVTGGVRWAKNEQNFRQISGGVPLVVGPPSDFPGQSSEDVVTYMLSPRLHFSDDTMVYARVATGYRPGGPNPRILNAPPTVDADSLINYEVGLKTQFLDRRALLNFAAFYIDWKDIQQTVSFGGVSGIDNTGDAVSKGFEIETAWSPVDRLRVGINAAYTDAKLTSPAQGISAAKLGNVPEWSASAIMDYEFNLAAAWRAHVGGGYRYVGEQGAANAAQTGSNTSYVRPSYKALDLSADATNGSWTFRVFARNVMDERAYTGGGVSTNALNIPYAIDVNVLQPRTVGVSVDVSF